MPTTPPVAPADIVAATMQAGADIDREFLESTADARLVLRLHADRYVQALVAHLDDPLNPYKDDQAAAMRAEFDEADVAYGKALKAARGQRTKALNALAAK